MSALTCSMSLSQGGWTRARGALGPSPAMTLPQSRPLQAFGPCASAGKEHNPGHKDFNRDAQHFRLAQYRMK